MAVHKRWGGVRERILPQAMYVATCVHYVRAVTYAFCVVDLTLAIDLSQPWSTANVSASSIQTDVADRMSTRRPDIWYGPNGQPSVPMGRVVLREDFRQLWTLSPDGHGGGNWTSQLSLF